MAIKKRLSLENICVDIMSEIVSAQIDQNGLGRGKRHRFPCFHYWRMVLFCAKVFCTIYCFVMSWIFEAKVKAINGK